MSHPEEYEKQGLAVATFAGGCFWCMAGPFEVLEGVKKVTSGYTGGSTKNPTYEEVSSGLSGHFEAIQVIYDPKKVSYNTLLDTFWRQVDPTDAGGQFVDRGSQYHTAIFYRTDAEKKLAEASKVALDKSGKYKKPVITPILPYSDYYEAEDYHQGFHKKSPDHYQQYRQGSGRDDFLNRIWGPSKH